MADFPDVPTFAEIGHGGATMMPWWGMMAPAGTPPADRRAADAASWRRSPRTPAVRERLKATFVQIEFAGPQEFARRLDAETALYGDDHPRRQHQAWSSDMKRSTDRIRTTHAGRLPVVARAARTCRSGCFAAR